MRTGDGGWRIFGVTQRLAEHSNVDTGRIDRWALQVAESKFAIFQAVLLRCFRTETNHLLGVIDRDHFLRAARQQFADQTFARTEICDFHWGDNPQEEVAECLPGPAGAVAAVEAARDLVEINLRLLLTESDGAFQVHAILGEFGHFSSTCDR